MKMYGDISVRPKAAVAPKVRQVPASHLRSTSRVATAEFSRGREPTVRAGKAAESRVAATEPYAGPFLSPLRGSPNLPSRNRGLAPTAKLFRRYAADTRSWVEQQGRRPGLNRRPRHRRSGYTLVEMLVVISVNSVLMAAAVTLLAALVKSDRSGQQHFERTRALVQLAKQFCDDVATASNATIAADKVGETLRLRFGDERTVEYLRDGERIRRIEQEGSAASSREAYSLAELSNATFGISEDELTTLSLTFTENINVSGDTWRIDAWLARDRRFAGEEGVR